MSHQIKSLENATFMRASESYSLLFFTDKKAEIKTRPMKFFAHILENSGWRRIHKSFIVNPLFIKNLSEERDMVCLISGEQLPISRRKLKEVLKWRQINKSK